MAVCSLETMRYETAFTGHFCLKYYNYLLRLNNTPINHSVNQSTP
jgi:hypothetical protein